MASPVINPVFAAKHAGPMLIGHLFNWGLHGVLSVQVYLYYLSFPLDNIVTKATVVVIYILEIVQTILATRDAFRDFGPGWGNLTELNRIGWIWFSVPVMSSIISCIAQLFYARRIWFISKKIWVPGIVALLALTQAAAGISEGVSAHKIDRFSDVQRDTYKQIVIWLGGTALCDVVIAFSMLYYLYASRTAFRSTNILLAKMVRITIETGLLCATFAVLDLVLDLSFPDNDFHVAPALPLSKLYSNSLLALLNSRIQFSGGRGESNETKWLEMSAHPTQPRMESNFTHNLPAVRVNIRTEQNTDASIQVKRNEAVASGWNA